MAADMNRGMGETEMGRERIGETGNRRGGEENRGPREAENGRIRTKKKTNTSDINALWVIERE
jgi:hypothetical protein